MITVNNATVKVFLDRELIMELLPSALPLLFTTSEYLFKLPCVCPHDWGVINATSMHCPCRRICSFTPVFLSFGPLSMQPSFIRKQTLPEAPIVLLFMLTVNLMLGMSMGMKCMWPLQNSLKKAVCELLKLQNKKLTHWCLSYKRKVSNLNFDVCITI